MGAEPPARVSGKQPLEEVPGVERAVEVRPCALGIPRLQVQSRAEELDPPVELEEGRADDDAAGLGEPLQGLRAIPQESMTLGENERPGHGQEAVALRAFGPLKAQL